MALTILERKPLATTKDGEKYVDLTAPSMRYSYDPYLEDFCVVNEQTQMRPDLLSRTAYGSTDFWDILLKYNGVSNPFSLNNNDFMLIPSLNDMQDQLAPDSAQNAIAESVRNQYVDVSKKSKVDPKLANIQKKRIDALQKKAKNFKTPSTSNLPPNLAEAGDKEIVIENGRITFGPHVSKSELPHESSISQPLSKSTFIARLLKGASASIYKK